MRYLLMLLLSWLPVWAGAVEFDQNTRSLPLGRVLQVFEDVRGDASIDEVSAPAMASRFVPHEQAALNAGYSRSVFWLKVDLQYRPKGVARQQDWLLELAYPPLDHLDLYLPDSSGHYYLAQRTGDALPFSSRQVRQNNYLFNLDFTPGERQVLYLRLQSEGSIQAPLTLWSSQAYLEAQPVRFYVLGMIYGVLLGMLVYNLFIYLSVRDTSYLYYIFYIAAFGLYQLSVNGAAVQYFWPNNPWWANASTPFLIGAAAFFGSLFSRSILQTARRNRWLDRLLVVLIGCSALVMLLSLVSEYALALRLATALALAFILSIFAAGIVTWAGGLRVARYFVIAWSAFLLGGLINTLMVLGYLPHMFLTMYASQIGSAVEVCLLSLALADRINAMREEQASNLSEVGHKLEQLNQQLARSNRLKDEFLATLTHELRTPMNGVIGSLELMNTVQLDPELEQYQQTAAGSARDMMRMVNGILTLTELQAGRLKPDEQVFSLHKLLGTVHRQFAVQAYSKGLSFTLEGLEALPDRLCGDGPRLAQCLECLLDNALKFTRAGAVILRVRGQKLASGEVGLTFVVIDTGIGFARLEDARLYQRFFQLDGSMTRQYGGLGIGLAICRQLVEVLGGQMTHESEPGCGSRFQIDLQMHPVPGGPPCPLVVRRRPQECRVLVVDDNSVSQLVVRGMLLKLGYQVRTADSGEAACLAVQRERTDAVLLDGRMDMAQGQPLCERLCALPEGAGLAIVVLSVEPPLYDGASPGAGVVEHLVKPVRFDDLQRVLYQRLLCERQGESAGH